ncbi:MAG: MurT ligase domain-containing protein [Propionibacteriaceae bacterium]|nr:MurT ligase domain-containing protein [Propionibacteriaceae bacterium]
MPMSLTGRARLRAATLLGDAAAVASRVAGKGTGASIRGQVLTRLAPSSFDDLLAGKRVAAVSGTNGKTTTNHLLAAAIRASLGAAGARRVVTNADGGNLHQGIVSALAKARSADIAVLECDERVIPDLIRAAQPEVLVFLNFSRDQLDRNHEIKFLARSWREALAAAGDRGPVIVANANDPLVVWSAGTAKQAIWVDTGARWTADAALCPACGTVLDWSDGPLGRPAWDCPGCELTQPAADYTVAGDDVTLPTGRVVTPSLQVPGAFNRSNAACALAAAIAFGVSLGDALKGLATVKAPAGRFAEAQFGATTARLMLAKNPAGWAEMLPLAGADPVVLAIDSALADGEDVSWLWDVEYEQLAGRRVTCTGPRAADLAVRLAYAGVDHDVIPDVFAALAAHPGHVDVMSTYTPFQDLLLKAGLR